MGLPGGDVAATPAFSSGMRATTTLLPGQAIDWGVQVAGNESFADFDPIASFPPASLQRIDNRLLDRPGLIEVLGRLLVLTR